MRFKDCIKIAKWDLKANKDYTFRIIVGFSVIIVSLFCSSMYALSYREYIFDFEEKNTNSCYYVKEINEDYTLEKYLAECKRWNMISEKIDISSSCITNYVNFPSFKDLNISKIKLQSGSKKYYDSGNKYKICNEYFGGQSYDISTCRFMEYSEEFDYISDNTKREFDQKYMSEEYLIGKMPDKRGEIMLSDLSLLCMGVPRDQQESLIGKKITLFYGEEVILKDYFLSGIYSAHVLSLRESDLISKFAINCFVTNFYEDQSISIHVNEIRYYLESFQKYSHEYNNMHTIDKAITGTRDANKYMIARKEMKVLHHIFLLVFLCVLFTVTICTRSIIYFYRKRIKYFIFILNILGITKKQVKSIIYIEILKLTLRSLIIGVYFGIMLILLVNNFYFNIINYKIGLEVNNILMIGGIIWIFILILCNNICTISSSGFDNL